MKRQLLPEEIDKIPENLRGLAHAIFLEESNLDTFRSQTFQLCFHQTFAINQFTLEKEADRAYQLIKGVMGRINDATGNTARIKEMFELLVNLRKENADLKDQLTQLKLSEEETREKLQELLWGDDL
jgi:DNA-binding transcriptional regulator GbsR (MarR family)